MVRRPSGVIAEGKSLASRHDKPRAHNRAIDSTPPLPRKLLALYHTMVMARAMERQTWLLHRTGQAQRALSSIGGEAWQAAAAAALRPGIDWVVPWEADIALCLACGLSPVQMFLALFGRAADPTSGGRLEPGAFGSRAARIVPTRSGSGAQVLHAAGLAYASRARDLDEVTLVSVGVRASETGDWHEGINFAAVHRLPIVCVVVEPGARPPSPLASSESDPFVQRARGYGLAAQLVDGVDFDQSLNAFDAAARQAREGGGPTLVHAALPEFSSLDATGRLLASDQLEHLAELDPISAMRQNLLGRGILDDANDLRIQSDCVRVAQQAADEARAAAAPLPAAALENVLSRTDA